MFHRTILLFAVILAPAAAFAQRSIYRPFKMVFIAPDTASIGPELMPYCDTVERSFVRQYYLSVTAMEELLASRDYPPEMKKEFERKRPLLEEKLNALKGREQQIREFRCFETISAYSTSVFDLYFNEYPPFSTFAVVRPTELKSKDYNQIARTYNADYVVSYKDIETLATDSTTVMSVITVLYSRRHSKVLFEKETLGNINSAGGLWTCSDPLSCLLISSVRMSTDEIHDVVENLQLR